MGFFDWLKKLLGGGDSYGDRSFQRDSAKPSAPKPAAGDAAAPQSPVPPSPNAPAVNDKYVVQPWAKVTSVSAGRTNAGAARAPGQPAVRVTINRAAPAPAATRPTSAQTPARPPPKLPGKAPNPQRFTAQQFTPITDQQALVMSDQMQGWIWARRDRIPSLTDLRTQIIDRAMVGHGLLTQEQLVQIHEVGAKMDQIRPTLEGIQAQANNAVKLDREARQKLKAEKQAAAVARKKQHAEDVAARHAQDIIYLGRGVSQGLNDRRAHIEKLQAAWQPVLSTPADLAQALDVSISTLRWLSFHAEAATVSHYVRFQVPKKSGGTRELAAPHQKIAASQQWILSHVLTPLRCHAAAHGFLPKHSTLTNAKPHVGRAIVLNMDLKDFFPSVTFPRVRGFFQSLGHSPAVATILALLCTECPRREVTFQEQRFFVATGPRALPQGACTSPALSNLVTRRLDARLAGIAAKLNWTYTRYADDLTFSADGEAVQKLAYLQARIRHIVEDEGFTVNPDKTRVQRQNCQQSVTGIVVNAKPNLPRKLRRRIRAILHLAKKQDLASLNTAGHPNFPAWIRGNIAYINMVNPQEGQALLERWNSLTS